MENNNIKTLSYRDIQQRLRPYKGIFGKQLNLKQTKNTLYDIYIALNNFKNEVKNTNQLKKQLPRYINNYLRDNTKQKDRKQKNNISTFIFKCEYYVSTEYNNKDKTYYDTHSTLRTIKATSYREAVRKLKDEYNEIIIEDSEKVIEGELDEFQLSQKIKQELENKQIPMKTANVIQPNFVKYCHNIDAKSYQNHHNQCVYSLLMDYYGPQLKRLTKEKLFSLFKQYSEENYKHIEAYDNFNIKTGVSAEMVLFFCQKYDIACYGYDRDNHLIVRNISNKRRRRPLIFYCFNGHFYIITDTKAIDTITKSQAKQNKKIKNDFEKEQKEVEYKILGYDMDLKDVLELEDDGHIIYKCQNLNHLFKSLVLDYKMLCNVKKRNLTAISTIIIKRENKKTIYLDAYNCIDYDYEDILSLCKKNNIKFKNQPFGSLCMELNEQFSNKRKYLSNEEKKTIIEQQDNKCNLCNKENKEYDFDHIEPFCVNYNNDLSNFQAICKDCHKDKCDDERDNGNYFKFDKTISHYNERTKKVIEGDLFKRWAFVEKVCYYETPGMKDYYIDINKCRRNLLTSKRSYPVYSSLDDIEEFDMIGYTKREFLETGFYYVDYLNYFPLRGNGWYSAPLVQYCLDNDIINLHNIKYQYIPSMKMSSVYFKNFLNSLKIENKKIYKNVANSLVGYFGIRKSQHINVSYTSNKYEASNIKNKNKEQYNFKNDNSHIFNVEGMKKMYEVISVNEVEKNGNYLPFYFYIMDLEAVELHKMSKIIEKRGGVVKELNTDGILYSSNENIFEDIETFTFSDKKTLKYKLEEPKHLRCEMMKRFMRDEDYIHEEFKYKDLEETPKDTGFLLLGKAGCGKSTLIKNLIKDLDKSKYVILGTTNKAAVNIGGLTIDKWIKKATKKLFYTLNEIEYVIVDEVSMMREIFYSLLMYLKRVKPELKIVLVGDYEQLPPVNDRVKRDVCYYRDSKVMYDIVDGQRLILTECKRSDDKLFNMFDDIENLEEKDFNNKECLLNLAYTNKKVKEINRYYNEKAEGENVNGWKLYKGQRLIACINDNKLKIAKNKEYYIKDLDDDNVIFDDFIIEKKNIKKFFVLGYCMTIHKSQGSTFNENYTIHEWEKLSDNLKYVAISRATKYDYVNVVKKD